MHLALLRPALALLLAAPFAAAQSPEPLVEVGDALQGVGKVTAVVRGQVDDFGEWLLLVETDNPAIPALVVRNGGIWVRVADPLLGAPGAMLAGFDAFTPDGWGGTIWNARLRGTAGGASDDQAILYDKQVRFRTGEPTAGLGAGFPPGTVWSSFDDVRFGPREFEGLLRGTFSDPAVPGSRRTFVATAAEYGSIGICCLMKLIAAEGQTAPGLSETIAEVRTSAWSAAVSSSANAGLWSCDLDGPTGADGCVFRYDWNGLSTLIAREGDPAPVPGRVWGPLETPSLDLNTRGDWTLRAELDPSDPASDGIVLRNGLPFAREGDALPAIAPFVLDDLGQGRAQLTDDGRVLWYGHWNDPSGPAEALFLDHQPLVRAGATTIGGVRLVDLAADPDGFSLAPKGQFLLFRGTLADGTAGAWLLDLGGMQEYCSSKHSSKGCYPVLDWSGFSPPSASAGAGFVLRASHLLSQVPGLFFYGTTGRLNLPFLGGTLCVAPPLTRMPVTGSGGLPPPASSCTGQLELDFNAWIASGKDPTLVAGQDVFVQAWFRDPGLAPPADVGLTHGLEFFILP